MKIARSGEIEIRYGVHASPFGPFLVGFSKNDLCRAAFLKGTTDREALSVLREVWPKATFTRDDAGTAVAVAKIFTEKLQKAPSLLVQGTDFQIRVWQALQKIPKGKTASYTEIAGRVGSSNAVRAVGTACGKNPIAVVIPCHRVLTSTGGIGGYRWGVVRKRALLAYE